MNELRWIWIQEPALYKLWERYAEETSYAREYSFDDVLNTVETIGRELNIRKSL